MAISSSADGKLSDDQTPSREWALLALFGVIAMIVMGLVGLDTGVSGMALFALARPSGRYSLAFNMGLPRPGGSFWCVVRRWVWLPTSCSSGSARFRLWEPGCSDCPPAGLSRLCLYRL